MASEEEDLFGGSSSGSFDSLLGGSPGLEDNFAAQLTMTPKQSPTNVQKHTPTTVSTPPTMIKPTAPIQNAQTSQNMSPKAITPQEDDLFPNSSDDDLFSSSKDNGFLQLVAPPPPSVNSVFQSQQQQQQQPIVQQPQFIQQQQPIVQTQQQFVQNMRTQQPVVQQHQFHQQQQQLNQQYSQNIGAQPVLQQPDSTFIPQQHQFPQQYPQVKRESPIFQQQLSYTQYSQQLPQHYQDPRSSPMFTPQRPIKDPRESPSSVYQQQQDLRMSPVHRQTPNNELMRQSPSINQQQNQFYQIGMGSFDPTRTTQQLPQQHHSMSDSSTLQFKPLHPSTQMGQFSPPTFVRQNSEPSMHLNNGYNNYQPQFGGYNQYIGYNQSSQRSNQMLEKELQLRQACPRPVISFGFGKLVVMFPRPVRLNVLEQNNNLQPGPISVHAIHQVLAHTDYVSSLTSFPGPLVSNASPFSGPNLPVTNKSNLIMFINKELNKIQQILEQNYQTYGVDQRLLALKQLWEVIRIICSSETNSEQDTMNLIQGVKNILLQYKRDSNTSPQAEQSVQTENPAILKQIEQLLINGRLKEASQLALSNKMFAHAMLLGSMADRETYENAVSQFANSLSNIPGMGSGNPLRTLYMIFAGCGENLFKPAPTMSVDQFGNQYISHSTQSSQEYIAKICEKWQENLSIILANRTQDSARVIEQLGDHLWKDYGMVESAHLCYLVGDYFTPPFDLRSRIILVGGDHKQSRNSRQFINHSTIQMTEIFEYYKMNANPKAVLTSFQVYKLIYAYWLAEVGLDSLCHQYLEYIQQVYEKTNAQYNYSPQFVYQFKLLRHRMREISKSQPQQNINTDTGRKSVTGWLFKSIGSGIDKFIHGEDEDTPSSPQPQMPNNQPPQMQGSQTQTQAAVIPPPQQKQEQPKQEEKKTQDLGSVEQPAQRSSWFGWLKPFGSKKQANRGIENQYYYDETRGRWVRKGSNPDEEEEDKPPPPPPSVPSIPSGVPPPNVTMGSIHSRGASKYVDMFNPGGTSSGTSTPNPPQQQGPTISAPKTSLSLSQSMIFQPAVPSSSGIEANMHRSVSASALPVLGDGGRATPPVFFNPPFVPAGGGSGPTFVPQFIPQQSSGEEGGYKPPSFSLPPTQFNTPSIQPNTNEPLRTDTNVQ